MQNRIPILGRFDNRDISFIVSMDGKTLQEVKTDDLPYKDTVKRGSAMYLGNKRYWLFYDINDQCWLMGDDIEPLLINEEVTQTLEGYGTNTVQRKLTIYKNGEIYLQHSYELDPKRVLADHSFDLFYHPDDYTAEDYIFGALENRYCRGESWNVRKN